MSPSDVCVTCYEPLLLEIESDSEADESSSQSLAPTAVPDDVELPCGCHFHWYFLRTISGIFSLSINVEQGMLSRSLQCNRMSQLLGAPVLLECPGRAASPMHGP